MKYTVYLRTNLVNGKQYVGQTKNFELREKHFERINQRYANKILTEDRIIFGIDNFKVEILAEVDTREEAWSLEQKFILEFNTKYPNGYNMGNGGKNSKGTKHTESSRKKMSESAINYWSCHTSTSKGVPHSIEARQKQSEKLKEYFRKHPEVLLRMSEKAKQRTGEKNGFFGKKHSEEYKNMKSEQSKGKHYSIATEFPSKTVYQYDFEGKLLNTYPSTAECARKNGVSQSAISYACGSKTHKCKGHIYSFELL